MRGEIWLAKKTGSKVRIECVVVVAAVKNCLWQLFVRGGGSEYSGVLYTRELGEEE